MPNFRWTKATDALLGTATDAEIARRIGVTILSVLKRRRKLGIPPFQSPNITKNWGQSELGMLGLLPDEEVAKLLNRPVEAVRRKRIELRQVIVN